MSPEWDVVVVGAGPAGSVTAALCAREGYRTVLLERAHFPRAKACAEYLSPGAVAEIERLFPGEGILADAEAVRGMEILADPERFRIHYHFGDHLVPAKTLRRLELDQRLASAAVHSGTILREGFVVKEPVLEGRRVVGVSGEDGNGSEVVRGRMTVVADGARSSLAKRLGLAGRPRWPRRLGLVGHYSGNAGFRDGYGQMHIGEGGYCGVAPLPNGLLNVAMVVREDALRKGGLRVATFFDGWIRSVPALADLLTDCKPAGAVRGFGLLGARAKRAGAEGVLLVGDAAGFFDPFTGEGIYRAIRGASLAAHAVGSALASGDPRSSLEAYEKARKAEFRKKEQVTALVQLFVQYPSFMRYVLPRLAERPLPADTLGSVLGDVAPAADFLKPSMLWASLRP